MLTTWYLVAAVVLIYSRVWTNLNCIVLELTRQLKSENTNFRKGARLAEHDKHFARQIIEYTNTLLSSHLSKFLSSRHRLSHICNKTFPALANFNWKINFCKEKLI